LSSSFRTALSRISIFANESLDVGGVFDALQQVGSFAKVAVDSESGTLVWPNGVDFFPDVLYAEATGKDIEKLGNVLEVVQTFP